MPLRSTRSSDTMGTFAPGSNNTRTLMSDLLSIQLSFIDTIGLLPIHGGTGSFCFFASSFSHIPCSNFRLTMMNCLSTQFQPQRVVIEAFVVEFVSLGSLVGRYYFVSQTRDLQ